MADIDELSSDSDDEEYIPEGGGFSSGESDGSEGEPEEAIAVLGRRRSQRNSKDADQLATSTRKRQRRSQRSTRQKDSSPVDEGGEADESGEACEGGEAGEEGEAFEGGEAGGEASQEEKEKSRIDDLWASFKKDTELKTPSTISSSSKPTAAAPGTTVRAAGQGKGITGTDISKSAPSEKTVKVKQKYDFAGEEVEVEKEVAADSEEAKAFLPSQQQQQQQQSEKTQPISLSSSAPSAVVSGGPPKASGEGGVGAAALLTKGGLAGSKRSSGLSSVLQSIGKKPKLSTLEKSSLDWNKYKEEEGLEEELAQHSKDGYLDKQEFLQRADVRQFELEREERLKRFRRMY